VPHRPFPIVGDNKGAIDAVHADGNTAHTKHLEIHLDFMRERRELGELRFGLIRGVHNPADILTKPLARDSFEKFRIGLGMTCLP